jgi:phage terminase Nu1 subunit (DNA packaging protein)
MIVERSVLAECLNLSGASICQLARQGMPTYAGDLYDLGACIQWYIENRMMPVSKPSDMLDARKRLYEAQAHKTELEAARIRAETIEADLYLRDLQLLTAIIDRTLTQPDPDLAEDIADPREVTTISDRLQVTVDRVRNRIADDLDDYTRSSEV